MTPEEIEKLKKKVEDAENFASTFSEAAGVLMGICAMFDLGLEEDDSMKAGYKIRDEINRLNREVAHLKAALKEKKRRHKVASEKIRELHHEAYKRQLERVAAIERMTTFVLDRPCDEFLEEAKEMDFPSFVELMEKYGCAHCQAEKIKTLTDFKHTVQAALGRAHGEGYRTEEIMDAFWSVRRAVDGLMNDNHSRGE